MPILVPTCGRWGSSHTRFFLGKSLRRRQLRADLSCYCAGEPASAEGGCHTAYPARAERARTADVGERPLQSADDVPRREQVRGLSAPSKDDGSTDNTTVIMARTAPSSASFRLPSNLVPPSPPQGCLSNEPHRPVATPEPLARKASSAGGREFVAAAVGMGTLGLTAAAGTYLRHAPAPIEPTRESPTVAASASGVELGDGGLRPGPATTDALVPGRHVG